jgi:hypothetical protein
LFQVVISTGGKELSTGGDKIQGRIIYRSGLSSREELSPGED